MKNSCSSCPTGMMLRLAVGVSLALVGLAHYMNIANFTGMTSEGLGSLAPLGILWAYILPALQIVGGLIIAFNVRQFMCIGKWAAGIALASIAIGMTLKMVMTGDAASMAHVQSAFIWFLALMFAGKACGSDTSGMCKDGSCDIKK